ncbi:hypothetical protein BH20ACT2_BH20ACT2_18700 [soil metagenome]
MHIGLHREPDCRPGPPQPRRPSLRSPPARTARAPPPHERREEAASPTWRSSTVRLSKIEAEAGAGVSRRLVLPFAAHRRRRSHWTKGAKKQATARGAHQHSGSRSASRGSCLPCRPATDTQAPVGGSHRLPPRLGARGPTANAPATNHRNGGWLPDRRAPGCIESRTVDPARRSPAARRCALPPVHRRRRRHWTKGAKKQATAGGLINTPALDRRAEAPASPCRPSHRRSGASRRTPPPGAPTACSRPHGECSGNEPPKRWLVAEATRVGLHREPDCRPDPPPPRRPSLRPFTVEGLRRPKTARGGESHLALIYSPALDDRAEAPAGGGFHRLKPRLGARGPTADAPATNHRYGGWLPRRCASGRRVGPQVNQSRL